MNSKANICFLISLLFFVSGTLAQSGTIRGYVYNKTNGEPVMFTNVYLENTTIGTATDGNGFFTIMNIAPGNYTLSSSGVGFDTARLSFSISKDQILTKNLFLHQISVKIGRVTIESRRQEKLNEVNVSRIKITAKDIDRIPSIGGESDLAQYLTVLPGVISSGDQGGQLYIRGGAPVNNKILLDGMTLYNAFHSIGLFSVYESEIIRSVNVYTGGFNAEYGGRISAVVDVKTRNGNSQKFGATVAANPFLTKAIFEGPIMKLKDNGSSVTYLFSGKHSYLEQTAPSLYPYVSEIPGTGGKILPYTFTDLFGKISIASGNGSKINFLGYNFSDHVDFSDIAQIGWKATGVGADFTIVPGQTQALINGNLNYSNYSVSMLEADGLPRYSSVGGFDLGMDFTYFYDNNSRFKYGVDINGFLTEYKFFNFLGLKYEQNQNTTEAAGYFEYRKFTDKWVIEPGLRLQYYASLANLSFEPRFGLKYNATDKLRFKFSGGVYSQNLISTKSDRDVVNLFTGYLSGPEETLTGVDGQTATHKLQKSIQAISGMEYDISKHWELNLEPYYKHFSQLININRNKTFRIDPDFMIETGEAYGVDLYSRFENAHWYVWATYSLSWVTRFDGEQVYHPHYDRRHNANLLVTYQFGNDNSWEASARWNLGSGFPFTRTQGFYEQINFLDGAGTDYLSQNGQLGILYEDQINAGRLPYYHRLDISLKRSISFSKGYRLEAVASVANVYNRSNIFYFDRVRYSRVNQLPIIPSLSVNFSF